MHTHSFVLLLLVALVAGEDKYPDTFDHLDVEELLADEGRTQNVLQCLIDKENTACKPAGELLKNLLAEIVRTDCAKCTEAQQDKIGRFFAAISQRYPEQMQQVLDKYDPTKEYRNKYAQSWAEAGIKLKA